MLDEREINAAIAELEYKESSYSNYEKLASLYTIRNEMQKDDPKPAPQQLPRKPRQLSRMETVTFSGLYQAKTRALHGLLWMI